MKLFIEKESMVDDIKKLFCARYPYLKIEFYKKPFCNVSVKKEIIPVNIPLIQHAHQSSKAVINIGRNITVADLENYFSLLGLKAEIFRKSGNVWVETSLTNNWTLDQQNKEGEEISRHFSSLKIKII